MMQTFSACDDDGVAVTVIAKSAKDAADKTAEAIARIGLEIDPRFFEDDINDAYVSDDVTVSDWLASQGLELTESNLIVQNRDKEVGLFRQDREWRVEPTKKATSQGSKVGKKQ